MQAQRQTPARNEDAAYFRERLLNVHVGESNGGNYPIETLLLEGQAFTGALLVSAVWESYLGERQALGVDVKPGNLIRSGDTPES